MKTSPSPSLLSLVPHDISRDPPFDGDDNHPLPIVPDVLISNQTTAAMTAFTVATVACNNNCLKACIIAASKSVWGIGDMFPTQLDAVYRLLHPMWPNHLAVIQRTGAGKTHILRMLGVIERGIVLIFIPLLTLSADVMSKFTCANHHFRTVIIQHLDELCNANKSAYKDLLERCQGLCCSTTTTVFLFLYLQFLINHSDAKQIFIECSNCTTHWKEMIFDKASRTVSWLNVDALFLSLAATGVLEIQNTSEGIMWIVGREVPVL
jgi:hypothetical protein